MITASMQAVIAPILAKFTDQQQKDQSHMSSEIQAQPQNQPTGGKRSPTSSKPKPKKSNKLSRTLSKTKSFDSQESDVRKLSGGVDSLRQETKLMLQQLQDIKAQQQRQDKVGPAPPMGQWAQTVRAEGLSPQPQPQGMHG
eukprot:g6730.t1